MGDERHLEPERPGRGVPPRLVALVVVLALVVAFGVDNRRSVPVGFVFDDAKIPLVWVIFVSLVAGAVLERLYVFVRRRQRRRRDA